MMEKRNGLGLTVLVLSVVFLPFGCASSKMAKQKEALIEVHKPVIVEKTGQDMVFVPLQYGHLYGLAISYHLMAS